MTVKTDLASQYGPQRRLFARIDGIKQRLWQEGPDSLLLWNENSFLSTEESLTESAGNGSLAHPNGKYTLSCVLTEDIRWDTFNFGVGEVCNCPRASGAWSGDGEFVTKISGIVCTEGSTQAGVCIYATDEYWYFLEVQDYSNSIDCYRWDRTGGAGAPGSATIGGGGTGGASEVWFKVIRSGSDIAFYYSLDGSAYTLLGTDTQYLPCNTIYLYVRQKCGLDYAHPNPSTFYAISADFEFLNRFAEPPASSDLVCLRAPETEWSYGLDLAEMTVAPSSMMIELSNIRDPDTPLEYFFARLFAGGRWTDEDEETAWLLPIGTQTQLDADATAIGASDLSAWDSSGEVHIGQETCSYTGIATSPTAPAEDSFSGVTKGLYPCTDPDGDGAWGSTYKMPDIYAGSPSGGGHALATVPYSYLGRRIALWIVTRDRTTGAWHTPDEAELLWVGRITDPIDYSEEAASYRLGCENILVDLERKKLGGDMPSTDLAKINLSGPAGITLACWHTEYDSPPNRQYGEFAIAAGIYDTPDEVAKALLDELDDAANWTTLEGSPATVDFWLQRAGDKFELRAFNHASESARYMFAAPDGPDTCHPMHVLGFSSEQYILDVEDASNGAVTAEDAPYIAYHPASSQCNGDELVVNGAGDLWDDQGDYGTTRASVCITKEFKPWPDKRRAYFAWYDGWEVSPPRMTLVRHDAWVNHHRWLYVGQQEGEEAVAVDQRYIPSVTTSSNTHVGPFEALLPLLLSTGTDGYNGTYDTAPMEMSVGMEASLVDHQSFIDADQLVYGTGLDDRTLYVLGEEGIPFIDLLKREGKLFGFFLAWDQSQSKLSLKSANMDTALWVETLDASNNTDVEKKSTSQSTDTVINSWECNIRYDHSEGDYDPPITISDDVSIAALRVTKKVEIEHPGIWSDGDVALVKSLLKKLLLGGLDRYRYPYPVLDRSLAPELIQRLSIGEPVKFEAIGIPDPFGSGLMSVSCMAQIINLSWGLLDGAGQCTLLLNGRYDALRKVPWAASAIVDKSATNGGWNAGTYTLTLKEWDCGDLSTDDHDGLAFEYDASSPDKILIIQTNPSDPTSPLSWGPYALASAYNEGASTLVLAGTPTLTGWVATNEYCVIACDYDDAPADQRLRNAYQADSTDGKLDSTDRAQLWG